MNRTMLALKDLTRKGYECLWSYDGAGRKRSIISTRASHMRHTGIHQFYRLHEPGM